MMTVEQTTLKDCLVITPKVFLDPRGYFLESFNEERFKKETGLSVNFVQDNQSMSSKGVLRGLHFQIGAYEQAKLVTVVKGSVLDVSVDLRRDSPSFGKNFLIVLSEQNKKQVFIPKGFAHGFLVLEDDTILNYKCDNYYNKASERGIIYNDETLAIDWNISKDDIILSEKDAVLPTFESLFV